LRFFTKIKIKIPKNEITITPTVTIIIDYNFAEFILCEISSFLELKALRRVSLTTIPVSKKETL
jgi:hypothetical protein